MSIKIYKVGGYVRDKIMGIESNDVDYVVVGATPKEMLNLGFESVGKDFPVFLHPQTREEYALARKEFKRGHGYHGFDFEVSGVTLEDDLYRRDITINAIAMDADNNLIDPFNGKKDLENKTLRHVSLHFREDPLRVLRVARFASKLNFNIHPSTLSLMQEIVNSGELSYLTPERILLELEKALATSKSSIFFRALHSCGALKIIFPEVFNLMGVMHHANFHPEGNGFLHTLAALDYSCELSNKISVRFATLCHDFGKTIKDSQTIIPLLPNEKDIYLLIRFATNGTDLFIYLYNKKHEYIDTAYVDIEDKDLVIKYIWSLTDGGYLVSYTGGKKFLLHRLIMNAKPEEKIDHIDTNKKNCKRNNII